MDNAQSEHARLRTSWPACFLIKFCSCTVDLLAHKKCCAASCDTGLGHDQHKSTRAGEHAMAWQGGDLRQMQPGKTTCLHKECRPIHGLPNVSTRLCAATRMYSQIGLGKCNASWATRRVCRARIESGAHLPCPYAGNGHLLLGSHLPTSRLAAVQRPWSARRAPLRAFVLRLARSPVVGKSDGRVELLRAVGAGVLSRLLGAQAWARILHHWPLRGVQWQLRRHATACATLPTRQPLFC
jgi:hypothetical protein